MAARIEVLAMRFPSWFVHRGRRAVWSDARRKLLALEGFAETEENGGRDLLAVAERCAEPTLRDHLMRHGNDELRHARLFRERASELARESGLHRGLKDEQLGRAAKLEREPADAEVDADAEADAGATDGPAEDADDDGEAG